MNKTNKKNFIKGAIFGLLAPFIGMFAGLQVAPFIGTILMFPFIIMSIIVGQPFGEFSIALRMFSFILSIILWGLFFVVISNLISKIYQK